MTDPNKRPHVKGIVELIIESITGSTFRILAHVAESIYDIKLKIEVKEGISASQQHLVWKSRELNDELTLEDYGIEDVANLKLVPAMKGGPINFRRVVVQDQLPPEFAELTSIISEAVKEKAKENRSIAVFVIHDGELLNVFNIRDSDYLFDFDSLDSMFDIEEDFDLDEEEKKKEEEDDRLREKMSALRKKLIHIPVDKSEVNLPKPVPPTIPSRNSLLKIPPHRVTKPVNPQPLLQTEQSVRRTSMGPATAQSNKLLSKLSPDKLGAGVSSQASKNKLSQPITSFDETSSRLGNVHRASGYKMPDKKRRSSFGLGSSKVNPSYDLKQFGGSLPYISLRQSIQPVKTRRFSLPEKSSTRRDSLGVPKSTKMYSTIADNSELQLPGGISSSSFSALSEYLVLAESFLGASRFAEINADLHPDQPSVDSVVISSATPAMKQTSSTESSKKKDVPRCSFCSKKMGIASTFDCRCGLQFCVLHRYPESHACTYNYKDEGRKEIRDNNPVVKGPKLPKI